ncbi:Aminomethyltransferase folate-binding domain-containing protein [Xylariaceae sp. FL0016]|nr:Aminomethyltransferase folate-binding domain-containing protein [Xylariaceae sp. FL0016]
MQVLPRIRLGRGDIPISQSRSLTSGSRSICSFVCPSCRRQKSVCPSIAPTRSQRYFSSSTARHATPPTTAYARLPERRLLSVSGLDAPRFLQGIITSSITVPTNTRGGDPQATGAPRPHGFYSGFLNATGRVLHDVFVYPDTLGLHGHKSLDVPGTAFLVEVDAAQAGSLLRHIKRYKLRSQLKARLLDDTECTVWQAWGERSGAPPLTNDEEGIVLEDTRAPGMGHRILSTRTPGPELDMDRADPLDYRVRRYLLGVAEGQAEIIKEQALPLEANMDLMGGIDFRKGCYVGQELTIRTKHRGVVRKRILPVRLYDKSEGPAASMEYDADAFSGSDGSLRGENISPGQSIGRFGKKGRSAGSWLAGVGNVGLALCRLQIMTDVELPGEAAAAPFDPASEFVMQIAQGDGAGGEDNGKAVKIQAFVPDWLRTRLAESHASSH